MVCGLAGLPVHLEVVDFYGAGRQEGAGLEWQHLLGVEKVVDAPHGVVAVQGADHLVEELAHRGVHHTDYRDHRVDRNCVEAALRSKSYLQDED